MSNLSWLFQEHMLRLPEHITQHLVKLSRRRRKPSPKTARLLMFVENESATTRPDDETFAALCGSVSDTGHFRWREQVVAAWALGQANLTEAQRKGAAKLLVLQLDEGADLRGQRPAQSFVLGIIYATAWAIAWVALLFGFIILIGALFPHSDHPTENLFMIPFGVGVVCLLGTPVIPFATVAHRVDVAKRMKREAARSLGCLGLAEGVPALLRASQNSGFFERVGQEALMRTLPTLRFEEHYGALGSDVVPNLCRLLERSFDFGMGDQRTWQLLIIGALEEVGDARAFSVLEWKIKGSTNANHGQSQVVSRAEQVLSVLRERAARETEQTTLLRGADAPIDPQTLLRSYERTVETPPEQLLRAGQKKDE